MPEAALTVAALRARLAADGCLIDAAVSAPARPVTALTDDSRAVTAGGLFAAIRGTTADGHRYVEAAWRAGAACVLCEAPPEARPADGAVLQVSDSRRALAVAAAAFYDDPAEALTMIGVTGTNGKTTVATLIHHLLHTLHGPAGLLSTVAVRVGDAAQAPTHTTPDPVALQRTLRAMVDAGCTACAMEVSSHALDQRRVYGIPYDVAVFTNLTQDHLDYHGTMAAYERAKKRLFDGLDAQATAVFNADDPAGPRMVAATDATRWSYGTTPAADGRLRVHRVAIDGLTASIDGHRRTFRLTGRFNAYNLAAAYGAGRAVGLAGPAVADALAAAPPVRGRLEQHTFADGRTVVIDYAHTPDALANVLDTLRALLPDGRALWCVFGCGGDRDRSKRPRMGRIAEARADRVIVTSDNPRTEDPASILDDIRAGLQAPAKAQWIVDRAAAIEAAAQHAAPGDVVLIAGKGHETYQVVGTERRPFDDRAVARQFFEIPSHR
ncbi:UDP-N-acetylmuramoyl-L-alanyl-D-glutamate--2,6-diaminopimelate ligase [Salisaeta longa]|uniref:UDP-N-acetylmuramoyl-L-alanyl-D-glutamate--2, 6-diaminopimelate ligase n=1 Tax=Salisaeta longa TaxID=503170 RepID=UPI0003B55D47|nr:UDP-N-acetylmuramoyl-L-alanyl-D-glutamate--2,6-diaminopimelate ligase [Salisaeta longa]